MLDLPLGVVSRVEKIGGASSRGDVSYGLVCKVSQHTHGHSGLIVVEMSDKYDLLCCLIYKRKEKTLALFLH